MIQLEKFQMFILSIGTQAAHQSGEDEISLSTQGRTYTVDFHSMQQINEDTGTTRPVQRRLNPSSLSSNMVDMSASASSGTVNNANANDSGLLSAGMTCQFIYTSTEIIKPVFVLRCVDSVLSFFHFLKYFCIPHVWLLLPHSHVKLVFSF